MKFKLGDIVKLNSGGPDMTVLKVIEPKRSIFIDISANGQLSPTLFPHLGKVSLTKLHLY